MVWLRRLLGEADILAAASQIDERRQQLRHRRAKQRIERRTRERLLDATLEVKQDFQDAMKEPQKHRRSPIVGAAARGREEALGPIARKAVSMSPPRSRTL
jgi:hypothetical protein